MDRLATVCEQIAARNSRLRKVSILTDYLRSLDDEDLLRAVRFLSGIPYSSGDAKRLSIGYALLRDAALAASGWDALTLSVCVRETGDPAEAIALLQVGRTENIALSLAETEALYEQLGGSRRIAEKIEILRSCLVRFRPLALKYFLKIITGDLRIGLLEKTLEEAVAGAAGLPLKPVRDAVNRSGALERVALAARHGTLDFIEARLFHPVQFMLAKPLGALEEVEQPGEWYVEDKYDGIRAQAHVADGRVLIYSRGFADVTGAFPELESALRVVPGSLLLDGEITAWSDGRALPFAELQQRLARKAVPLFLPFEVPVVFIIYDLLFRDGALLFEEPLETRRATLENVLSGRPEPLLISPLYAAKTVPDLERLFENARQRGNEGLILKHRGSLYESGRRGGAWVKWKKPYGTLDVVVTAVEQGHGRRASVLSDYTFAVRSGNEFLNVGKAYSGLTDQEIRELTRMLRASAVGQHGPVLVVRPEIVFEVAFDGLQKSNRHKSGYALRFPRIVRWRRDKRAHEADTLDRVKLLYKAQSSRASPAI